MIGIYKKLKLIGKNYDKWLVTLINKLMMNLFYKLNLLNISCDEGVV